jgi:raffinose/stachyose/melibiose transport system permease protein
MSIRVIGRRYVTRENRAKQFKNYFFSGLAIFTAMLFLLPIFYMLLMSLRSRLEIASDPLGFPVQLHFENYTNTLQRMNYPRSVLNTIGITLVSSLFVIVIGSLAAYPLARLTTRFADIVYRIFLAGLTIPFFVLMTPLYLLMKNLGLVNTYFGIVLLYTVGNLPLAVFFFTSFIRSIPRELEEAAAIDGASPFEVYRYIVFPLLRPVTATLVMFVALSVWNDLILPFLMLNTADSRTVMVSVFMLVGTYSLDPTLLFPAAVMGALPLLIFYFLLQRQIVAAISAGAVKG